MNSYARISKFGKDRMPPCAGSNDPLTVCLTSTLDAKFQNGSIASTAFGAASQNCQRFMTQRCADKWDGFCEYYYREQNGQNTPIYNPRPNLEQDRPWESEFGFNTNLTLGEQLLRNTAERKYCTYPGCEPQCEPFDPTNPDSPNIIYFKPSAGSGCSRCNCVPVCGNVNPKGLDNDPVMNRLLDNPDAGMATLINICNTTRRQGIDLSGTRLGRVCDQYQKNMSR
jgi:hypothetical protein